MLVLKDTYFENKKNAALASNMLASNPSLLLISPGVLHIGGIVCQYNSIHCGLSVNPALAVVLLAFSNGYLAADYNLLAGG